MKKDAQTTVRSFPSPCEERTGRGLGRGVAHKVEQNTSSPRPSPPSDGGEGVQALDNREPTEKPQFVQAGTRIVDSTQITQGAIPSPHEERAGRGPGRGASSLARLLRRNQTDEEKQLWHALKAGRFSGFKFRRQHQVGDYYLDFYCPTAKLSIELDGFHHGLPEQQQRDEERRKFLESLGIEEMRYWNHQWKQNREGVLMEIWEALHRRTGCVAVMRKVQNHRFVPPNPDQMIPPPAKPTEK